MLLSTHQCYFFQPSWLIWVSCRILRVFVCCAYASCLNPLDCWKSWSCGIPFVLLQLLLARTQDFDSKKLCIAESIPVWYHLSKDNERVWLENAVASNMARTSTDLLQHGCLSPWKLDCTLMNQSSSRPSLNSLTVLTFSHSHRAHWENGGLTMSMIFDAFWAASLWEVWQKSHSPVLEHAYHCRMNILLRDLG